MSVPNFIKPYVNIITKTIFFVKCVLSKQLLLASFIQTIEQGLQFILTSLSNHAEHQEIISGTIQVLFYVEESGDFLKGNNCLSSFYVSFNP